MVGKRKLNWAYSLFTPHFLVYALKWFLLTEEDAGEEVHGAAVHPGGHLDGAGEDVARICATLPSPSPIK